MKKILLSIMSLSFILSLTGCGHTNDNESSEQETIQPTSTSDEDHSFIQASSYIDALRGNLSAAKMTLYDVTSHDEEIGPVYEITFDNPELGENSQVNSVSVNTTNEYFFDNAIMVCPNSGWVYIYAYSFIGSIRGDDGLKDILSDMKIDMNNGFYGTTLYVYHDNNWRYSVDYLDNKVVLMIDSENE